MQATWPAHLRPGLHRDSVDAGQASSGEYLSVWNLVLLLDFEEFSMPACVEMLPFLGVALANCPSVTCVEQLRDYYCPVYRQLCL